MALLGGNRLSWREQGGYRYQELCSFTCNVEVSEEGIAHDLRGMGHPVPLRAVAGAESCAGSCISQREGVPGTEVFFAYCHLMVG